MKTLYLSTFLFLYFSFSIFSQNQFTLLLEAEKWNFKPGFYYFSEVKDERTNMKNAGQILKDGNVRTLEFKNTLETDLLNFLNLSIEQDTLNTPLIVCFERFAFKETGSQANHKITLDYGMKIYRVINNKRYKIYEVNGRPEFQIRGGFIPNAYSKMAKEALKSVFENFNDWISKNSNLPSMARKAIVILEQNKEEKQSGQGDTIVWNDDYKLKWSDFKGSPRASSFMAESNCVFSYRAQTEVKNGILELHINLNACFDRNSSWVREDQKKDTLLAHEQLHFDICELNIRQLKKKLVSSTFNPMEFDTQIKTFFDEAWNTYSEEQQHYDSETGHGIIMEKQILWQEDISNKLKNISR